MAFDTARLLGQIKLKGCLPTGRFADSDLLAMAYDALVTEVMPLTTLVREEYYTRRLVYSITAGQSRYPIPPRASCGLVRDIKIRRDSSLKLPDRIEPEDLGSIASGNPNAMHFSGSDIVLVPSPSATTGELWVSYPIRPSILVDPSATATITAINAATNTVSATLPTTWTNANLFDFVKGTPHFDLIDIDRVTTTVGAGVITFNSALPTTLTVGDAVCLAGETLYPMIPPEFHVLLAQATATLALESMGNPAAKDSSDKAEAYKKTLMTLIGTRSQGTPKKLNNRAL